MAGYITYEAYCEVCGKETESYSKKTIQAWEKRHKEYHKERAAERKHNREVYFNPASR